MIDGPPEKELLSGNITIHRATRQPCPVCGHPTGDCVGELGPPTRIVGLTGGVIESLKDKQTILVEENIYEDRQITPFTKTKVILHHKGSYITLEQAKNLGIA
jgi:hypothetical protein